MVLVKIDKLFLDILDKKHDLLDYKGNNIVAKLEFSKVVSPSFQSKIGNIFHVFYWAKYS